MIQQYSRLKRITRCGPVHAATSSRISTYRCPLEQFRNSHQTPQSEYANSTNHTTNTKDDPTPRAQRPTAAEFYLPVNFRTGKNSSFRDPKRTRLRSQKKMGNMRALPRIKAVPESE